jgi:hypothetical protein
MLFTDVMVSCVAGVACDITRGFQCGSSCSTGITTDKVRTKIRLKSEILTYKVRFVALTGVLTKLPLFMDVKL